MIERDDVELLVREKPSGIWLAFIGTTDYQLNCISCPSSIILYVHVKISYFQNNVLIKTSSPMKVKHLNVTIFLYLVIKVLSFLQNTNKEKYRKRFEQKLDN